MKRAFAATAVVAALSIGGIAVAATGGGGPQRTVPEHDPRSPGYHNPANADPKSPGYIEANTPRFQHAPDDEFACGYKFKDLPAYGYHPPDYVDNEGVGPAVVSSHGEEDPNDPHEGCLLMTRAQVEAQRQYLRENGQAPSGEVAK